MFCTQYAQSGWHQVLGSGVHTGGTMEPIVHNAISTIIAPEGLYRVAQAVEYADKDRCCRLLLRETAM